MNVDIKQFIHLKFTGDTGTKLLSILQLNLLNSFFSIAFLFRILLKYGSVDCLYLFVYALNTLYFSPFRLLLLSLSGNQLFNMSVSYLTYNEKWCFKEKRLIH